MLHRIALYSSLHILKMILYSVHLNLFSFRLYLLTSTDNSQLSTQRGAATADRREPLDGKVVLGAEA